MFVILFFAFVIVVGGIGYIWATLAGARFYWRWMIFLPVLGILLLSCCFIGAFCGGFNSSVSTEYRSHFWKEFILTVKTTPDFSSSAETMLKKTESPEFTAFKEKILPKYPSVLLIWTGVFLLAGAIGLEFWKKTPWNRIGILILTLTSAGLLCNYGYETNLARYSCYHLEMTCGAHRTMFELIRNNPKKTRLSQEEIAGIMRTYSEKWRTVCHGEPYTELLVEMAEKEAPLPSGTVQTPPGKTTP